MLLHVTSLGAVSYRVWILTVFRKIEEGMVGKRVRSLAV